MKTQYGVLDKTMERVHICASLEAAERAVEREPDRYTLMWRMVGDWVEVQGE